MWNLSGRNDYGFYGTMLLHLNVFVIIINGTTEVSIFVQNGHLQVLALLSTASTRVGTKSRYSKHTAESLIWTHEPALNRETAVLSTSPMRPPCVNMHNSRLVGYILWYLMYCTIIFIVLTFETDAWFVHLNWICNVYVSIGNLLQTRKTYKFIVVCVERLYHVGQSEWK